MGDGATLSLGQGFEHAGRRFLVLSSFLSELLPDACIEHVGSTAVPGCLTKGDLDVLVRVPASGFAASARLLDERLSRSSRNEPLPAYVEYDYAIDGSEVSVQLVAEGSWHDRRFSALKSALLEDPALIERYNELKQRYVGRSMDSYQQAKAEFIDSVLESQDDSCGERHSG